MTRLAYAAGSFIAWSPRLRAIIPLSFIFFASCAHQKTSQASSFPTREQAEALTKAPVPRVQIGSNEVEVNEWELQGPFLETVTSDSHQAMSPFEKLLQAEAALPQRRISDSEAMHCVARELGHFFLAHQGFPTPSLNKFIIAACGALLPGVAIQVVRGDVPDSASDDAVFQSWKKDIQGNIDHIVPGSSAGAWFGRKNKKAIWVLTTGKTEVHLKPFSRRPDAQGNLILSGQVLKDTQRLNPMVTTGEWGFSTCSIAPTANLPEFEFSCPFSESALVGVYLHEPRRVLGHQAFEIYAWPKSGKFRFVRNALQSEDDGKGSYTDRLIRIINQVRARLSRVPLRHAENQSAMSSQLAPHYFSKDESAQNLVSSTPFEKEDLVALSIIAGWRVNEDLVNGSFLSTYTLSTDYPHRLAEELLLSAHGRSSLLDAAKDVIAVGLLTSGGVGALLSTYESAKPFQHDDMVELILKRLNSERQKRGRPAAKWVMSPPDADARVATLLREGQEPPKSILSTYVDTISSHSGSGHHAWVLQAHSLDAIEFPSELLNAESLGLLATIGRYKNASEPWVSWTVFLVTAAVGPQA